MTRDYLTLADVIAIHDNQIETYGGLQGLRDPGQLDAALFRPQSGYYTDVIAEAAAVWESLSQNHPFVDGNKRTSFASMFTFLAINQVELTASADETYRFVHDLCETGGFQFEALESWLRENTRNLSTRP
jgi:death-on-curing protein